MKHLFKRFAAGVTAACMCMALAVPMEGSADGIVLGDINNDGSITMVDLTNLNKYLAGQVELVDYVRADLNANCVVDVVDSHILQRYLTGAVTSFPYTGYGGGSSYASVGATAVNSLMGYTVFDATTGEDVDSYYLDSNSVVDNSRAVIGTDDSRYGDDSLSGVVKIFTTSGGTATGFIVDSHTIATAAHCVFNQYTGDFQQSHRPLEKIVVFNENGNVEVEITDMYDVHIPNGYITYSPGDERQYAYDYAMITVATDLSEYAKMNLGVMTDGMMSDSEKIYCTGFPERANDEDVNDNEELNTKLTGEGYIKSDYIGSDAAVDYMPARRFCHDADTSGGNSGGPVYLKTEVGTSTYYTVVGIHTRGIDSTRNGGVQMTTELLHFYKNNPNIYWE